MQNGRDLSRVDSYMSRLWVQFSVMDKNTYIAYHKVVKDIGI